MLGFSPLASAPLGDDGAIEVTSVTPSGIATGNPSVASTGITQDHDFDLNTITKIVTVVNDGGNKFAIDGTTAPVLTLERGKTYIFDVSDSSNSGHPLAFKDSSGNSYTSGITSSGTAGSSGATVTFVVPSNAPDSLRYYCTVHGNGMGNTITVVDDIVGILTSAPSIGSPTFTQVHDLAATSIVTGAPLPSNANMAEAETFTTSDLASGAPSVPTLTLSQDHDLTAGNIVAGTPSIGSVTLSQAHDLTATSIVTGNPVVNSPEIDQDHSLTASAVTTGSPQRS